jgi:hypothetical protein
LRKIPKYLTPADIARLLGKHIATVRLHVRQGKIPSKTIGYRRFIPSQFFLAELISHPDFIPETTVLEEDGVND